MGFRVKWRHLWRHSHWRLWGICQNPKRTFPLTIKNYVRINPSAVCKIYKRPKSWIALNTFFKLHKLVDFGSKNFDAIEKPFKYMVGDWNLEWKLSNIFIFRNSPKNKEKSPSKWEISQLLSVDLHQNYRYSFDSSWV